MTQLKQNTKDIIVVWPEELVPKDKDTSTCIGFQKLAPFIKG